MALRSCTKCKAEKPPAAFRKNSSRADGLCVQCKTCMTKALRAWEERNPEKVKATCRASYQRHKASRDAASKVWAAENPERRKEHAKRWSRDNKVYRTAATAAYNARRIKATPVWSEKEEIEHLYKQAAALSKLTGVEYHVDHIVPLRSDIVCGLHVRKNLRILRGDRNVAKGNTLPAFLNFG